MAAIFLERSVLQIQLCVLSVFVSCVIKKHMIGVPRQTEVVQRAYIAIYLLRENPSTSTPHSKTP